MNKKQQFELIEQALIHSKKAVVIPEVLIKFFKSMPLAAVFKQLFFWSDKGLDSDGWVYKTAKELAEECCLSKDQVDRSMSKLSKLGVIEFKLKKANGAPTRHYRVNHGLFIKLALQGAEYMDLAESLNGNSGIAKSDLAESLNGNSGIAKSITDSNTDSNAYSDDKPPLPPPVLHHLTDDGVCDAASMVFFYWLKAMGKTDKIKFTPRRKKAVLARLKSGYSVDDLKQAIDGCAMSPFHMGQSESGVVYDDLELICRNPEKVDGFIAMEKRGKPTNKTKTQIHNESLFNSMRNNLQ